MKVSIRNYRGCERADLDIPSISLIAGANHHGKTSVCQAIAAALSGQAIPFIKPGARLGEFAGRIPKKSAGALVRVGNADGHVAIETESGKAKVGWPESDVETEGEPPRSSVYATGLIDIMKLEDKTKAAFFSNLIGAAPSKDDLAAYLSDCNIRESIVDRLWAKIEKDDWDPTHKTATSHGAKLKGQWEDVAGGGKYGKTKAEGWIPEEWEADLESSSRDSLEAALASARSELETAIAKEAVGKAEIERLEETANAELPTLETLEKAAQAAQEAVESASINLQNTPRPFDAGITIQCPHCEEWSNLVITKKKPPITDYTLEKPGERPSDKELKKQRKAYQGADMELEKANKAHEQAEWDLREAQKAEESREKAVKDLEAAGTLTGSAEAVEAAREGIRGAEGRLAKFDAWTKATKLHKSVQNNQHIIDSLAPEGVRKAVLLRALSEFNGELKGLSESAKWGQVLVTESMDVTLGGRPYILLSDSEQYRARAVLQVATAQKDGSCLVIFDGADILDRRGREGLIRLVIGAGNDDLHALIAMTMNKPAQMPPLDDKGLGRCYWISDGLCSSVAEMEEAA